MQKKRDVACNVSSIMLYGDTMDTKSIDTIQTIFSADPGSLKEELLLL
jgi:hypothetical protein